MNGEGEKESDTDVAAVEEELEEKGLAADPRDVIIITGREENCEKAKQALLVSEVREEEEAREGERDREVV